MKSVSKILSVLLTMMLVVGGFVSLSSENVEATGLANTAWPMFHHDLQHTGQSSIDTSWNIGDEKWSFTTGDWLYSSPAIGSDGTIYIGSLDDKLYAINPDGTEKWNFPTGDQVASSPAIDSDGTIYVGSWDHKLYAINPDGTQKWSFMTGGGIGYASPTIGTDGIIYIGSNDYKLYAIYPDATEKWNFPTGGAILSSPAIDSNGIIYLSSFDHKLYAIYPDGTEKWNFLTGSCLFSSPSIGSDGTIYVSSWDGKLYAINPDGTEKWSFPTAQYAYSTPAIGSDGTIYFASTDTYLYAINPDGTEKWRFWTVSSSTSSPVISFDGTIYYGSRGYLGKLYAINPDGSEKWRFTTGEVHSTPAIDSIGTIYVGSWDDRLYAIGIPRPVADFTWEPPTPYEGDEIQFIDTSWHPDGQIVSWEWTFDYLSPSAQQNPIRTYSDNGIYYVTLEVTDNNGYTDSITKEVFVENLDPVVDEIKSTLYENEQRTHGYWKKQCDFDANNPPPSEDHVGIKQEYIDFISENSIVWAYLTTKDEVEYEFTQGEQFAATMLQKLRMHLITVWLNIAAQFLFIDSPLNDPLTSATTIREFIEMAEDAILRMEDLDPFNDPTIRELEDLKNVADHINNDPGNGWVVTNPIVGVYEATATDPGSDDLTFEWDFENDGVIDAVVTYYNDPLEVPDPLPSPWGLYPVTVTDVHIIGYQTPPPPYEVIVTVYDDDGGMARDEDPLDPWSANWMFRYETSSKSIEFGFVIYNVEGIYIEWDSVVTQTDPLTGEPIIDI